MKKNKDRRLMFSSKSLSQKKISGTVSWIDQEPVIAALNRKRPDDRNWAGQGRFNGKN